MSSSKETKTQKVLPGEEPVIHPKYNHKLIKVPAVARVQIHAASAPSVKDTLVLRSTEGKTKGECTYWKERTVKNASRSDGFLNLSFSPGRNDGTAERARTDRRYTLAWRPGGKKKAEVILFEVRTYEETWKTGHDDDPDKIAELMAARVQEAGHVILSDRTPAVLKGPDVPDAIRETDEEVADAGAPLPYDVPMPDPESAEPMKSRSGGSGSGGGEGSSLPPGPRWITLLRRRDEGKIDFLATYKVDRKKKYQLGTFSGQGPASASGGQKDVLLPLGEGDVYARMSMVPPTKKRIEQQAERLDRTESARYEINREGPGHPFVPLPLRDVLSAEGPTPATTQLESPSQSSGSGPGGTAYLPNPVAAAQGRLQDAKAAHKRFADWKAKIKDTIGLTGLVGGTCLNEAVGRTYLKRALQDPSGSGATGPQNRAETSVAGGANSESSNSDAKSKKKKRWGDGFLQRRPFRSDDRGPFGPSAESGVVDGGTEKMLGTVLHGHQCQQAFLHLRRDRALRATRGVFETALFEDLLYDIAVLKKGKDEGGVAQSIVEAVSHATNLGEGASMAAALCEEGAMDGTASSALSSLMKGQKGVLAPEGPTEAPVLKALVKLAQRSKGGLKELAVNAAPAILAVGSRKADLTTEADAPASLALLGAFLTAEGSGGSVSVETRPGPDGQKTLAVQGGSTATFVQRHVKGLDHRRAEDQMRWSVKNVSGLSSVTVGAGGAPQDALELAVVGIGIRERPTSGALSAKGAFGHLKTVTDVAEAATDRASLAGVATVLTGVEVAWGVVGNLSAERAQGVQSVDDPKYFKAASTLVKVGVGAAVGSAASSALFGVAVGFTIGKVIDAGAAWLERWENVDDNAADDPLVTRKVVEKGQETIDLSQQSKTDLEKYTPDEVQWHGWLPEKSHWGTRYEGSPAARDTLATLMKPGKDKGSAPPTKPFRDQTEQFVEKAFTFPTAVGVPPRPSVPDANTLSASGPPKRLFLSIIPEYLSKKRGTFMVDAHANTAGMVPVPIQCAVHYVKTPTALRYTVRPKGESLALPAGTSLSDWADEECWPIGWKEKTPVPDGGTEEKVHFPVHVESGPRITEWPVQELTKAHVETIDLELGLYRSQQSVKDLSGAEKSRRAEARRLEQTVNPGSVLTVGGIESILKSGQFQVTGTVYFNPLQPFDPNPTIPAEGQEPRFASEQQFEYRYPDSA